MKSSPCGFRALEYATSVDADLSICIHQAPTVTYQATGFGIVAKMHMSREF